MLKLVALAAGAAAACVDDASWTFDLNGATTGADAPPSYARRRRRGYLDGAPGTCAETWTVPSLPGCEAPQFGCPATACGEDRRWCCRPAPPDRATEWRHCGDDAPTAAPTYGPSVRPTRAPVDGA
ncbi:hypothetical protein SO694_00135059 [Aureococcus anophagefferens]|uniref:Secreted protein n=1 Tax=Aureococcus anophagefferens TaxID=44056 RepID=A0ABR1GGB4_AURAN